MKFEVQQCFAARLRRLSRVMDSHLRSKIKHIGISENQMNILLMLSRTGQIGQGQIGKNLVLERSTVSRGVALLERKSYVRRTNSYQPEVALTDEGDALVAKLLPEWEKFMNEMNDLIGDDGLQSLVTLENKLI